MSLPIFSSLIWGAKYGHMAAMAGGRTEIFAQRYPGESEVNYGCLDAGLSDQSAFMFDNCCSM
jgi:hypothetical protein